MIFSLWLIAALVTVEAGVIPDEDTTDLPIVDMVDMRIVDIDNMIIGDGDDEESVTDIILVSDETTVKAPISSTTTLPTSTTTTTTTTESLEALEVFQEVHRLDDIPLDNWPVVPKVNETLLEQLELNEVANNLGEDDIVDVINNFIADEDPVLQLFLSICFLHPNCGQDTANEVDESPLDLSRMTPFSRDLADNLLHRRTEKARNILVSALMNVQDHVKALMFKYIQIGVASRGVSVPATKKIIDAVKNIWISVNSDLEYAKTSMQELFYLVRLDTNSSVRGLTEVAEVILNIPAKVEKLFLEATQDGYKDYVRHSSWNSWKRNPRDFERK